MAARGSAGTQRGRGDAGRGRGEKSTPKTPAKEETDDDNRSWEVTTETTPARRTSEENVEAVAEEGRGRAPGEAERQELRDPWLEVQGDPWSEDPGGKEVDEAGKRIGAVVGEVTTGGATTATRTTATHPRGPDGLQAVEESSDPLGCLHRHQDAQKGRPHLQVDGLLQARFEHLTDGDLTDPDYLNRILSVLDVLAGEKQSTEKRRAVRKALFEGSRRR